MDVICTADEAQAEALAARLVARELRAKPDAVLGLATGRTMERVYAHLVRLHREEGLDFSRCRTFNLDEYVGIPAEHPGSYRHYMDAHLFRRVNIRRENTHIPDGMAPDLAVECRHYDALIREAGGLDLQLLGLGLTGHIGFNEPPADFASRTHDTCLDPLTREQNAGLFGGDAEAVPARALTMGIGTILEARRCLLLVTGAGKADILAQTLEGPVTNRVPGSVLQGHPECTVVVDEAAATGLRRAARARQEMGLPG
jgi:glucosamine-6-phosphate deaminase